MFLRRCIRRRGVFRSLSSRLGGSRRGVKCIRSHLSFPYFPSPFGPSLCVMTSFFPHLLLFAPFLLYVLLFFRFTHTFSPFLPITLIIGLEKWKMKGKESSNTLALFFSHVWPFFPLSSLLLSLLLASITLPQLVLFSAFLTYPILPYPYSSSSSLAHLHRPTV